MSFRSIFLYTIFFLLCVLLTSIQMESLPNDPGLGWHLRSGQEVLENGRVFRADPYLAHPAERPWVADQWLGSVILGWLYDTGGWLSLHLVALSILFLSYAVFWVSFLTTYTKKPILAAIVTILTLKFAYLQFIIRPILFANFFFILFLIWLLFALQRLRNDQHLRALDWIGCTAFSVLWAQIHPYFILIPISFLLVNAGIIVEKIIYKSFNNNKYLIRLSLLLPFLMVFSTFLNPYGWILHKNILFLGKSEFLTNLMVEWRPLSFSSPEGQLFLFFLLFTFIGFIAHGRKQRFQFPELFLSLGFSYFAITSIRAVPLAACVLSPWVVYGLSACVEFKWFERFPFIRSFRRSIESDESFFRSTRVALMSLSFTLCYIIAASFQSVPGFPDELTPSKEKFPYGAIRYLKDEYPKQAKDTPIRILNNLNWGGFITFHLKGVGRPLIDDRLTLRDESVYREYKNHFVNGNEIIDYINIQKADLLLTATDSKVHEKLKDKYKILYSDSLSAIYPLPLQLPKSPHNQ